MSFPEQPIEIKRLLHYLVCGACGAASIPFALCVLGFAANGQLSVVFLIVLLCPAAGGALVGAILYLLRRLTNRHNGLFVRMAIGSGLTTVLSLVLILGYQLNSVKELDFGAALFFSVVIGLGSGLPAGILAHEKESIQQLGLAPRFPLAKHSA
jgi:hypothetical protein